MVVNLHDGNKRIIEADKKLIDGNGNLKLYRYEQIGAYTCPLKVTEVESFAAGTWRSVRATWEPSQETLDKGNDNE